MWMSNLSGPAEEPLNPEQVQQWLRRMSPPENEFPAGVGLTACSEGPTTPRSG